MILTNFDAFFDDNSFLHSFCNASSLTKNKLKSSNTWREPKILFSCILTYYEKLHCLSKLIRTMHSHPLTQCFQLDLMLTKSLASILF